MQQLSMPRKTPLFTDPNKRQNKFIIVVVPRFMVEYNLQCRVMKVEVACDHGLLVVTQNVGDSYSGPV